MEKTVGRKSKEKKNYASTKKEKGNVFDKILKENIRAIRKPIAEELLGKRIKSLAPLPSKMQTTLEIESDDFSLIEFFDGKKEILHLEFEVNLSSDMVYRVGEYHAVKQKQHRLPIHHFVFHIGKGKRNIRTQLFVEEIYSGFSLIHANQKPPEEYIASDIPEIVIMAVLGKYSDELKNKIVRSIIKRLQSLINNKRVLDKYIKQLFIFGRIRESVLTKNINEMTSLNYDITKDGLYLKGLEKGLEKGLKKGIKKWRKNLRKIKFMLFKKC